MGRKKIYRSKESEEKRTYKSYQRKAKERGKEFTLAFEEFSRIVQQNCHYCGSPPSNHSGEFWYNGIDRKENDLGYSLENSLPCCRLCNFLKGTLDYGYFLECCYRVALHVPPKSFEGTRTKLRMDKKVGQFQRDIGYIKRDSGKIGTPRFYLGRNKIEAFGRVMKLKDLWATIKEAPKERAEDGKPLWDSKNLEQARAIAKGQIK